ncbi:CUB and sushi domain-containing protein 1-like [Ptychodera flava]|uniref:CUB and sushi domain-containing protein 1-like n=1 Tax=Ptychodera flava TaxID=63121 RepID=UPI003969C8A1
MDNRRGKVGATSLVVLVILLIARVRGNGAKVQLVDGSSPYDGLVELYVNDTTEWLPVCGTRGVWHFLDADVVCNQLGYNGAMRSEGKSDRLRNDPRKVVDQVVCPANSITIDDCTFYIEESGHCNDKARITCNFDGYIGCFNNNASDPVLPDDGEENTQMTIEWCLDYCRERNWTYAGLYWRKYCHCGRQGTDYARQGVLRNSQCGSTCTGNSLQVCGGGMGRISIYKTHLGACGGQVNINGSRTIYSPGFPGYYPNSQDCTWILSSSKSMSFTMNFVLLQLNSNDDHVILYDVSDSERHNIRQFSGSDVPEVVCSHSSEVLVHFYSGNGSDSNTGLFAITFKEVYTICPLPKEINHGHFNVTGDCTKNWTLSVTCNEGLHVNTSHSSVVCYEDDGWNDTIPSCTAEVPVKLTDGELPNEGLVEVFDSKYGWLKVCLIGREDKTWSWNGADVVCTQLGYRGAMRPTLSKPQVHGIFGITSVNCKGDENSILECVYSTTNSCTHLIKTRCNYIGYVGCFKRDVVDHRWNSNGSFTNSTTLTIEWCIEYCRSHGMAYAGLKERNQCYCGQTRPDEIYTERNNKCNWACKGDRSQICGGRNALSVYPTSMGACGGHVNESGVLYSPGFPGNYPNNKNCKWILSASEKSTIKIDFLFLSFGGANDSVTMTEVIDGIHYDIGRSEEKLDLSEVTFSFSNEVYVTFNSEYRQDVSNGIFAFSFEEAEVGCQLPIGIENGNFKIIGDCPHSYSLYITCKEGFQATIPYTVRCRENGQWTSPFPKCLDIDCGEPDEVPNSSKEGDLYTYKNTVKYSCNDGYYIDGHDVITCDENGNWSKQPLCTLKSRSSDMKKTRMFNIFDGAKQIRIF